MGQIDLVMNHVLVYVLYIKITYLIESLLPDHSQLYVPNKLNIFTSKHICSGNISSAMFREEMKWEMREITNIGNQFSESVVL